MTPREQIAKRRRSCVIAAITGGGVLICGFLLIRINGGLSLLPDGRLSGVGCVSVGLMFTGYALFLIASAIFFSRWSCPGCGKNMGSAGWRRMNYCPLCGLNLDEDMTDAGMVSDAALKNRRKEVLLHIAYRFSVLLNFALIAFVLILFLRILCFKMERYDNAKIIGRFYAHECKNQEGVDIMRKIFAAKLKYAQTSNCWDRLCLPSDEEEYRKKVLDAFEKELARRKLSQTDKEETATAEE